MPVFLFPLSDRNYSRGIAIPAKVIYSPTNDVVLSLCGALTNAIPDSDSSGYVTAGNIVARRRESGNSGRVCVSSVLGADCWLINRTKENRFIVLRYPSVRRRRSRDPSPRAHSVCKTLAFGICRELSWLATRR